MSKFIFSARIPVNLCTSLLMLCFAAGCPSIQPARVTQFQQSTDTVHVQAQTTFRAINDLVTEDELDLVVKKKDLTESDVAVMLAPTEIAKWEKAFSAVDSYCKSLAALLDPSLATDLEQSFVGAATELKTLDKNALPDPIISTAFAEVAGMLIEAKAQADALKVASSADPSMQVVFTSMANAIGSNDNKPGLITTVSKHWTNRMGVKDDEFHRNFDDFYKAHPTPSKDEKTTFEAAQRQIVLEYIQLRDQRDAQLLTLTSLRKSLLGLAEAHSALARGSAADLSTVLTKLQTELDGTKALYDQFKALKPGAAKPATKPST
jgi:hypothetical protein